MNQARKGFHIERLISFAKAFINMAIVVGFLYQMIPAPNFTHKPCTLAVSGEKNDSATKDNFDKSTIMSQTINLN